ncbi:hypothetical protein LOD99_7804 [Oopsacas minuta]|uniref:Uncharacterized protein n=1 Tax=Oopsacas minuta TaxID=111878 RepID=A0AAV7JPX4_9METZ|nr:hypothetical protein LOD99_7804 [Oopsacas minuta]
MTTSDEELKNFSLTHQPSQSPFTSGNYDTSDIIHMSSFSLKLSHFIINPTNNMIFAADETERKIVVFTSSGDIIFSFPTYTLSILEGMLIIGDFLMVLSRYSLLPRYRLNVFTLDGYPISLHTWMQMTGEGFFNRISRDGDYPIGSRMAVTSNGERLIVESNLEARFYTKSTLRFYSDEFIGFRYSVRNLAVLPFTLHIQIIDRLIYQYCISSNRITCNTCKLDHFLPEEDIPKVNTVSLIRTDLIGISKIHIFYINSLGYMFKPLLHMVDTTCYILSMDVIDLNNGKRLTSTNFKVNLKEEPFYSAIAPDLTKILPVGIVPLSDGSIRTFWTLKNVIFLQN